MMRKRNVGILACVAGIVMGLGISQLNVAGIFEKEPMKVYNSEERKIPESAKSKLKDEGKCWLCGSDDQSLMDYFRKFDDLGIICTKNWYVQDMRIRNHDEEGNLIGAQGNSRTGYSGTGEGGCFFHTNQMPDHGMSEVSVSFGDDSFFDVRIVQDHLCQTCLDKLVESMEVYCGETEKPMPRDLVLVDFQTLDLYALQEHNGGYFVRDYYVEIESEEDGIEVRAFYCPKLKNGKKDGE